MNQEQVAAAAQGVSPKAMDKLAQVKLGMDVYDRLGKKVGHVDDIHVGGDDERRTARQEELVVAPPPQATNAAPVMMPVASGQSAPPTDALGAAEGMPREVHDRLMHDGYIRIDAGFLKHHRYVLPDQIDSISGNRINLIAIADDLIKH